MPITTLERFQNIFMRIGKIIYISQIGGPVVLDMQTAHMGLVDQHASGLATEFDVSLDVVNPLGTQVRSLTNNIKGMSNICKAALDSYLKKFIAPELGLAVTATYAEIEAALADQMGDVDAHVATDVDNADGIQAYFKTNFDITLPTDADPSIPDSYITSDVLPDA